MEIHPISGALGAECTGVDLSVLSDALMFEIKTALMDHQVIFFPNQNIFQGWMFSSSPSLSSLEHPINDIGLLGCKKE